MDKVRVFEIAGEAGSTSAEVIKKAADLGITLKTAQTGVSIEEAEEITTYILTGKSKLLTKKKAKPKTQQPDQTKKENQKESKKENRATKQKKKNRINQKHKSHFSDQNRSK
jgi:translation initiation factor IF-2